MRACWIASSALVLSGCALHRGPTVPEPARGPARDSLFQFDRSRTDSVAVHGVLEGMVAMLGPDVVFLRAGAAAAYGIAATRRLLVATAEPAANHIAWEPLGGGVANDLRAGYTFGVTVRSAADGVPRLERYIAFWSRESGGAWRIIAYCEVHAPPASSERAPSAEDFAADTSGQRNAARAVQEARANVRAADSAFSDLSYRMGAPFAFANSAAPNAVIFGDPQLVIGPAAIQEFLDSRIGRSSLVWQPEFSWVAASRDLGFTVGESTSTELGSSGAAIQRFGKYLTVWRRQSDGTWKFVVDGGSSSPRGEREKL